LKKKGKKGKRVSTNHRKQKAWIGKKKRKQPKETHRTERKGQTRGGGERKTQIKKENTKGK